MKRINYSIITGTVFVVLFALAAYVYWFQAKKVNDMLIADHVEQLSGIFAKIHQDCHIIDFEHQKNNINFLNVISFEGSEVGPMNLKYPKKWEGAYLKDNPTMQEQYYQVVRTKKGYFVVPGPAVKLANGQVIGKDILFDQDANIQGLIKGPLQFKGRPLAAQIMTGSEVPKAENTFADKIARDRLRGM